MKIFSKLLKSTSKVASDGKTRQERPKKWSLRGVNEFFEAVFNGISSSAAILRWLLGISAFILLSTGCSTTAHNNLNSTLWVQSSAEYRATSLQIYNMALKNIELALDGRSWPAAVERADENSSLPPAIVMDVDETVLDNSRYQANSVIERDQWKPETWDEWVALGQAGAVPGAVEFVRQMASRKIEVVYITNRECRKRDNSPLACPQEIDTIRNLRKVGIPDVRPENILLKGEESGWTSEKKSRREVASSKYRILMLFGDDLGDFLPNVKKNITPEDRAQLVDKFNNNWGSVWYMLPNPTYGSWMEILSEPRSEYFKSY